MTTKIEQEVFEVDIDTVMRFWANDYKPTSDANKEIINRKWYVDQQKGKVAFVLTTRTVEQTS